MLYVVFFYASVYYYVLLEQIFEGRLFIKEDNKLKHEVNKVAT